LYLSCQTRSIKVKKKTIILIHALYWFYIINQSLFPMYIGKLDEANVVGSQYFKDILITLILNALSFYSIYFTFPRIVAIKNKIMVVLLSLALILVLLGARLLIDWYFWKFFGNNPEKEMVFQWAWVWNELRLVIITGIYAVLISYMIKAIETRKLRDELINQRQAGELALLKSQVNPHFLFNTLNNIYSLVYHKSDEAPEAVMKFSSIMRYVLYDSKEEKVLLEKEIEYLKSYIELQKLRIKEPDFVSLEVEGNTDGIFIAPMLLIPFVENAFKHASRDYLPGISIFLYSDKQQILFEVSNFKQKEVQTVEKPFSGIRLSNIRRRLELIYPGRHVLEIITENDQYKIKLLIQL
jgi:two-component system, LytTR family, sensor kinase